MPGLYGNKPADKAEWATVKLSDADLEGIAGILHRAFVAGGGNPDANIFAQGMLSLRSLPAQGTFAVQNLPGMFKGNIASAAPSGLAKVAPPTGGAPTGRRGKRAA